MYVCMHVCLYVMYVCMHACTHACMHVCIYIYIWFRLAVRQPPPQWYESPGPGPWIQILMLFAHFRAPAYNLHAIFTTSAQTLQFARFLHHLGAPTSLHIIYMDYLHHWRQSVFIYIYMYIYMYVCMYIWFRFADMCVVSAWFSCIQLRLRVVTDAGKSKLHIYSDLFRCSTYRGKDDQDNTPHPQWGWGETTPTAGRTTGGDHDHGWGAELET